MVPVSPLTPEQVDIATPVSVSPMPSDRLTVARSSCRRSRKKIRRRRSLVRCARSNDGADHVRVRVGANCCMFRTANSRAVLALFGGCTCTYIHTVHTCTVLVRGPTSTLLPPHWDVTNNYCTCTGH